MQYIAIKQIQHTPRECNYVSRSISSKTVLGSTKGLPVRTLSPGVSAVTKRKLKTYRSNALPSIYTFKALIDLPIAIAIHSPGAVECPVGNVIPEICGDQTMLTISLCPV